MDHCQQERARRSRMLGVLDEVSGIAVPTRTNRMFGATRTRLGELSLGVPLDDGTVALTMNRSALALLLQDAALKAGLRSGSELMSSPHARNRIEWWLDRSGPTQWIPNGVLAK